MYVCLAIGRQMDGAKAPLSNFLMHLVVIQYRAVIKRLSCIENKSKQKHESIEVLFWGMQEKKGAKEARLYRWNDV